MKSAILLILRLDKNKNMFLTRFIHLLIAIVIFGSCSSSKKIQEVTLIESEVLDTLVVTAPKSAPETYTVKRYNPAADQVVDLKHMDLKVSFDWLKEEVMGNAILTISPYFYETDEISLDAVGMEILDVTLAGKKQLKYKNTEEDLIISLDRKYSRKEDLKLHIQYIARPTLGRIEGDGSSDQGLYFIDSDDSDPNKPSQIWSQGETEYNSHWFPTVDKPNERYTHDIKITVADKYATLSNGYLVSSNKYAKDTRTDHWRMDDEHAPYLTMITVGEFAVVKDQWQGKPLLYYVEKEYEAYAQKIFNHTPEMLTFFSDLTGVKYPWDQYAQVVIRDFVAGAMENTTAVTFGEFVQKTDVELIDNHNDDIVAHEMFHHWFGDYVTCESWANLTLNEGFANYSEYLWTAHKYGLDEADYKRANELAGYLYQAKNQGIHPLIHYSYEDKENMFDGHSYNKGGLVLHMLRYKIGDEAFFESIKRYLQDHAGSAVEVDELRMAFEDVTGLDLQVFFNQWYLSSGHPVLEITYDINGSDLEVTVEQIQSTTSSIPIFQIPLEFDLYDINNKVVRQGVFMNQRKQTFTLNSMGSDIDWVNFDPEHVLLAEFSENKEKEDYIKELQFAKRHYDLNEAMDELAEEQIDPQLYKDILVSDKHYWLKWRAVNELEYSSKDKKLFLEAVEKADNVFLKGRLLSMFRDNSDDIELSTLESIVATGKSWNVLAPALSLMTKKDPNKGQALIDKWKSEDNTRLVFTIASIIGANQDYAQFDYILSKVPTMDGRTLKSYNKIISRMLVSASGDDLKKMVHQINTLIFDSSEISSENKGLVGQAIVELQDQLTEEQRAIVKESMKM